MEQRGLARISRDFRSTTVRTLELPARPAPADELEDGWTRVGMTLDGKPFGDVTLALLDRTVAPVGTLPRVADGTDA